jgi:hypothetical protein
MKAILMISYTGQYGWNHPIECYKTIRNYYDGLIIIVNNFYEPIHSNFLNDKNIRYFTNTENLFELGAIKTGIYKNEDITHFLIIHDSCRIIDKIPDFNDEITFWKTTIMDISPAMNIVKDWCNELYPKIIYNDKNYKIFQGLMGHFSRKLLLDAFESGLNNLNIKTKLQAVASEGLFSIILSNYFNIKQFYENKIDDYMTGKKKFDKFIKREQGGRGPSCSLFYKKEIDINSIAHPTFQHSFYFKKVLYNSLHSCIELNNEFHDEIVLEYYLNNKYITDILTESFYCDYFFENDILNIGNIIRRNRHYMYTIKHFGITNL